MLDTARGRVGLVVLLLGAHVALFPLHAMQPVNEAAWVLPSDEDFIDTPQQYLGDRVVTGGTVQETDPVVIRVETTSGAHRVTITDTTITPEVGDKAQVYGTLTGPRTIQAINAFVVPQQGLWYTWTISFLAGLWVLTRLIRHWTVDRGTLGFHPRAEPLRLRDLPGLLRRQREDDHA